MKKEEKSRKSSGDNKCAKGAILYFLYAPTYALSATEVLRELRHLPYQFQLCDR